MLCDSNVWLALALLDHEHHNVAQRWLESVNEPGAVLFCRATQQSFLRLLTTASTLVRFGNPPLSNQQAWGAYDELMADDRIAFKSSEPAGLDFHWRRFAAAKTASPKLWMDAYLAAFAQAGGYQMVTIDVAFKQFDGLDLLLLGGS
jgi:toxin-antitoxin system PIN domain toxin